MPGSDIIESEGKGVLWDVRINFNESEGAVRQDWRRENMSEKLWCLFRRTAVNGDKICVANAEDGRVFICKYHTEEEAKEKCENYAVNTYGEDGEKK